MTATSFQDFTRDNGDPVTVEYSFRPGSDPTYSPMYGAEGGDPAEVEIIKVWPNTPSFDALCGRRNALVWAQTRSLRQSLVLLGLTVSIRFAERRCRPTGAELERFETWLIEHHVYEPDDWEF